MKKIKIQDSDSQTDNKHAQRKIVSLQPEQERVHSDECKVCEQRGDEGEETIGHGQLLLVKEEAVMLQYWYQVEGKKGKEDRFLVYLFSKARSPGKQTRRKREKKNETHDSCKDAERNKLQTMSVKWRGKERKGRGEGRKEEN
eukprot:749094-Hanusia_phi.AAC.3